ncbi:MAG TPA: sulfatase [Kofleriaceae bacterium]|nr:sulfatase [Kofleriaceae bacterium]
MLRLAAVLHSRTVHALAAVTIAAGAAGCSKKEAEGGERAGTSSSTGEKDRAEPSQRSKLHPHRSLLDEVSRAEVDAGGLLVDFGGADQHKYTRGSWRSGWSEIREGEGAGESWAVVDGRRAWLDMYLPGPAPVAIAMRARSPVAGQKITFYSGETALGTAELGADWQVHRVAIEPGALAPGKLRLELRSSKGGSAGVRAEVDWLWLTRDASETAEPMIVPRIAPMNVKGKARRALIAPAPRSYAFYLQPPEGAQLVVDLGATEKARFKVEVTTDDSTEPKVLLDHAAGAGWTEKVVSLADYAGKSIRLALTTTEQTGAVGWGEPEILLAKPDAPPAPPRAAAPAKNAIVILIDTARADGFGPFGGPDRVAKTPSYDELAGKSTVFTSAYNNENWTKPSVATSLSGLYPTTHDTKKDGSKLPSEIEILPERLKKEGFATAGFVANGYVSEKFGFQQGWDHFTNYIRENKPSEAERVYTDALAWLKEHQQKSPEQPFFLYIQSIDPHVVYDVDKEYWGLYYEGTYKGRLGPTISAEDQISLGKGQPPGTEDDLKWLRALYWGEMTYHDHHMGLFVKELESLGVLGDTLLVVTNDHGEELGERGRFGHGHQIHEELTRAPLLMRYDAMFPPGYEVKEVVEHVDLTPTILDVLGREPLAEADGVSFLPLVQGKPYQRPGYAIIEFLEGRRALRVGSLRFMVNGSSAGELYDLATDPKEEKELGDTRPISRRLAELHFGEGLATPDKKVRLRGLAGKRRFTAGTADIDPHMRRQLEALGYFGSEQKDVPDEK